MTRRTRLLGALILALVVLVAGACKKDQPKTTVPGSWTDPGFSGGPFRSLLVIGVGRNDEYRRLYETNMVETLARLGTSARASWDLFPDSEKLEKAEVLEMLAREGFDGVVLTRVLSVDQQLQYVPPKTQYVPTSQADLYMLDYDQNYATIHEPGYYSAQTTYAVETTLYTADKGERIWWALSETVDPDSIAEVIDDVAVVTAQRMKDDGLIP